jgi:hypothetical protein
LMRQQHNGHNCTCTSPGFGSQEICPQVLAAPVRNTAALPNPDNHLQVSLCVPAIPTASCSEQPCLLQVATSMYQGLACHVTKSSGYMSSYSIRRS